VAELRRWGGWALAAVAAVVIVVGLLPGTAAPVGATERAEALASNLRCPFCSGESIADAPSQIARDLEGFIVEKIEEGWTDDEIYAFFVSRYGERVRLDPPLGGWGIALWLAPLAIAAVGLVAIAGRRRPLARSEDVPVADEVVAADDQPDETGPPREAGPVDEAASPEEGEPDGIGSAHTAASPGKAGP
jgi:cytochrome c-type biogenesis protein CcmH